MNPLLIMLLLAAVHHHLTNGGGMGQNAGSQPPGSSLAPGPGIQAAQGPRGTVGGPHGATAPMKGGVPGMLNAQGALPHQQPFYSPNPMATGVSSGPRL